jgi:hypothetical protein
MDSRLILSIALALIGVVMMIAVAKKSFKSNGTLKTVFAIFGVLLIGYGAVSAGANLEWYSLGGASQFFLSAGVPSDGGQIQCPQGYILTDGKCVQTGGNGNDGVITYQPTATYGGTNKFDSTTSISGTSYYKVGTNKATTTAQTNVNQGDQIMYWIDNSSYYIKPVVDTAGPGVTPFNAEGYANSSATVTLYDKLNKQLVTDGAYNTTLSANGKANVEITYQGTAKGSAGPFGGLMVLEQNSSISAVTCTGDDLLENDPGYHLTYAVSATTHTYKSFPYGPTLDDGSGDARILNCQYQNGASAPGTGSAYYVKFVPANYYVTQNGDIVLDTEKNANGDNTRTGLGQPMATAYWA